MRKTLSAPWIFGETAFRPRPGSDSFNFSSTAGVAIQRADNTAPRASENNYQQQEKVQYK